MSYIADGSPAGGQRGVLVGFIESRQARALADAPAERVRTVALDGLAAFVGDAARSPDAFFAVDWSADPWTRGCYSGHVAPGAWTSFGPALREPCGPIHWAGTETAVRMCGYIDGAVESGRRAAAEVLAALGPPPRVEPLTVIWPVIWVGWISHRKNSSEAPSGGVNENVLEPPAATEPESAPGTFWVNAASA